LYHDDLHNQLHNILEGPKGVDKGVHVCQSP
jgi:hypothetical protein